MTKMTVVLSQLQNERTRFTARLNHLNDAVSALTSVSGKRRVGRRKMSAAAIARIRAAQKARWAKWRKQQKAT
jgi:hypothetical protein